MHCNLQQCCQSSHTFGLEVACGIAPQVLRLDRTSCCLATLVAMVPLASSPSTQPGKHTQNSRYLSHPPPWTPTATVQPAGSCYIHPCDIHNRTFASYCCSCGLAIAPVSAACSSAMKCTSTSCREPKLGVGSVAQLCGMSGSTWCTTRPLPRLCSNLLANLHAKKTSQSKC